MKRKSTAVHVATVSREYKGHTYRTHLLRRTFREDGKVKHETLGNLSSLPDPIVDLIRRALRGELLVSADEALTIEASSPYGHIAAVLGTLRQLGLDRLMASKPSRERDLVVAMIVARILNPRSKLATVRGLGDEFKALAHELGLEEVKEDELYAAMDWLLERQEGIQKRLAKRHLAENALVMYDVTSTYFEGRHCPLARLGYSRDGKTDRPQIVVGLLTDAEGCPVAVEVFEGNTADPRTLTKAVTQLRKSFGLTKVVLVADRGMITEARLTEDLKPHGLDWITALRAPAIQQLVEGGSLQLSLFDTRDLAEIQDPDYPGERLIVCKNPLLADQRARKRHELLDATEAKLTRVVEATQRVERPLRGKDQIGLRVGKVLAKSKVGKHFRIDIGDTSLIVKRDPATIERESALDGLYVLRTNLAQETLAAEKVVGAYKDLAKVERAFRCLKTSDLKIRPIFHRLADRVKAHVFLCMLAYHLEWHLRQKLAPLLFHEEDPEAAEKERASVVAKAQRSPQARTKTALRKTADGLPIHSFPTLLKGLATLCKHDVRVTGQHATFTRLTEVSPLQKRAFELLNLKIAAGL